MLQLNKIFLIIISSLIVFSCTLNGNDDFKDREKNADSSVEYNTEVKIQIPRIHPFIEQHLNSQSQSRAYGVCDKVKVTVKKGLDIISEAEFGIEDDYDYYGGHSYFNIMLLLPKGEGYVMSVESFNLKNSSTVPTVIGTSIPFNIVDGEISTLDITMIPKNPTILDIGVKDTFTPNAYFIEFISGYYELGSEHWYQITATSSYTEVNTELVTTTIMGEVVDVSTCYIFAVNEDGSFIDTQHTNDGALVFKSVTNKKYFICVLPLAHETPDGVFKSNSVSLSFNEYTDTNNSTASAKNISITYTKGIFSSPGDIDFYKVNLTPGKYSIESYCHPINRNGYGLTSPGLEIDITSESGELIGKFGTDVKGIFEVIISGNYYIQVKSLNSGPSVFEGYEINFDTFIEKEVLNPSPSWQEFDTGNIYGDLFVGLNVDSTKEYTISFKTDYYVDLQSYFLYEDIVNKIYVADSFDNYLIDSADFILSLNNPKGQRKFYLELLVQGGGTYAIKFDEITPVYTSVPLGELTVSSSSNGRIQYYKVDVTEGQELQFSSISVNNLSTDPLIGYYGDALFSVYDLDKNKYIYSHITDNPLGTFIVETGVTQLIVKVVHGDITTKEVAFKLAVDNSL